ncbi:MAG: hypothetical protein HYT79_00795 [Elusimicrobia bacterium]|nr:hypothetical protein [Elusimicrobiota bacterium]
MRFFVIMGLAWPLCLKTAPVSAGTCEQDIAVSINQAPVNRILRSVLFDADINDDCKGTYLRKLGQYAHAQLSLGLCSGGDCEALTAALAPLLERRAEGEIFCEAPATPGACRPNSRYNRLIEPVERIASRIIPRSMPAIQTKIAGSASGAAGPSIVPACLLPTACVGAHGSTACRQALQKLWWSDAAHFAKGKDNELWVNEGGFAHLYLGSAFTCTAGQQRGDTCALYSGFNLMAHYCVSPHRNPNITSTCPEQGPGFECNFNPDTLLIQAYRAGLWEAEFCHEDAESHATRCDPARVNPIAEEEAPFVELYEENNCADDSTSEACRIVEDNLFDIRTRRARERMEELYPGITAQYPNLMLQGESGLSLLKLIEILKERGFDTAYYEPTNAGWSEAMDALDAGHPIQISIDPSSWARYGVGGSHAVTLFGRHSAPGQSWVIVQDSNHEDIVKLIAENKVLSSFKEIGSGGLGLCAEGNDPRCAQ